MKSIILISLFLILFKFSSEQYATDVRCEDKILKQSSSAAYCVDYCASLSLEAKDGSVKFYRCCFATAEDSEGRTIRGCIPLTYNEYSNDIESNAMNKLTGSGYSNLHVLCSSNYLSVSILLALLISLF